MDYGMPTGIVVRMPSMEVSPGGDDYCRFYIDKTRGNNPRIECIVFNKTTAVKASCQLRPGMTVQVYGEWLQRERYIQVENFMIIAKDMEDAS